MKLRSKLNLSCSILDTAQISPMSQRVCHCDARRFASPATHTVLILNTAYYTHQEISVLVIIDTRGQQSPPRADVSWRAIGPLIWLTSGVWRSCVWTQAGGRRAVVRNKGKEARWVTEDLDVSQTEVCGDGLGKWEAEKQKRMFSSDECRVFV